MIWILFICGVLMVVMSVFYLYVGWESTKWPTTTGKVIAAMVREVKASRTTLVQPFLAYEYSVNGNARRSTTIGFFLATNGKQLSSEILRGKEVGKDIQVYYHPWIPALAVVEPGVKQPYAWLAMAGTGGIFSLSAGIALFAGNRYLLLDAIFGFFRGLAT